MAALDPKDGGYKSRKMVMAYVAMAFGTFGFLICAHWESLVALYPQYCMFLLASATIYAGGDVAHKWLVSKSTTTADFVEPEEESAEDEEKPPAEAEGVDPTEPKLP